MNTLIPPPSSRPAPSFTSADRYQELWLAGYRDAVSGADRVDLSRPLPIVYREGYRKGCEDLADALITARERAVGIVRHRPTRKLRRVNGRA